MKGGLTTLGNLKIFDLLDSVAATATVTKIGAKSVGGWLYRIQLSAPIVGVTSVYPGRRPVLNPMSTILIKLVQIGDTKTYDDQWSNKEITTNTVIAEEIKLQTIAYQQSMSVFCEPICPNIISFIRILRGGIGMATLNKFPILREKIVSIFENPYYNIKSIGFIAMEMLDGCQPISSAFPLWGNRAGQLAVINPLSTVQENILQNYLYQLIRLKKLGINHGDTHLENALYIENYTYINNFRVYLIDFGRATIVDTNLTNQHGICNRGYWSYRQMHEYAQSKFNGNYDIFFRQMRRDYVEPAEISFLHHIYNTNNGANNILTSLHIAARNDGVNLISAFPNLKDSFTNNLIFRQRNIPLIETNLAALEPNLIPATMTTNCCQLIGIDGNSTYVTINRTYNNDIGYREYITELTYRVIQTSGKTIWYTDTELHNFGGGSGIFLWIIGMTPDKTTHVFMTEVISCFEIGTTHIHLAKHFNIINTYASGQFMKVGNTIEVNFYSRTFMLGPHTRIPALLTSDNIIDLHECVGLFLRVQLNINIHVNQQFNIIMQDINTRLYQHKTFINETNCCENNENNTLKLNHFIKVNEILLEQGREPLYIINTTKDECMSSSGGSISVLKNIDTEIDKDFNNIVNNNKINVAINNDNKIIKETDVVIKDDIELGKYKLNTINNLYNSEINEEFIKEIEKTENKILLKNVDILCQYVNKTCMNIFKISLNMILYPNINDNDESIDKIDNIQKQEKNIDYILNPLGGKIRTVKYHKKRTRSHKKRTRRHKKRTRRHNKTHRKI